MIMLDDPTNRMDIEMIETMNLVIMRFEEGDLTIHWNDVRHENDPRIINLSIDDQRADHGVDDLWSVVIDMSQTSTPCHNMPTMTMMTTTIMVIKGPTGTTIMVNPLFPEKTECIKRGNFLSTCIPTMMIMVPIDGLVWILGTTTIEIIFDRITIIIDENVSHPEVHEYRVRERRLLPPEDHGVNEASIWTIEDGRYHQLERIMQVTMRTMIMMTMDDVSPGGGVVPNHLGIGQDHYGFQMNDHDFMTIVVMTMKY